MHYLTDRADKALHQSDHWIVRLGPRGKRRWDHCTSPAAVHIWRNHRSVTNRGAANRKEEEVQTLITAMAQRADGLDVRGPDLKETLAIYQRLSES